MVSRNQGRLLGSRAAAEKLCEACISAEQQFGEWAGCWQQWCVYIVLHVCMQLASLEVKVSPINLEADRWLCRMLRSKVQAGARSFKDSQSKVVWERLSVTLQ